jgi:hypothetical protein
VVVTGETQLPAPDVKKTVRAKVVDAAEPPTAAMAGELVTNLLMGEAIPPTADNVETTRSAATGITPIPETEAIAGDRSMYAVIDALLPPVAECAAIILAI